MADLNKLRGDVEWWRRELEVRQRAVTEAISTLEARQKAVKEAMDTLKARQGELTQAEREEAERASSRTN